MMSSRVGREIKGNVTDKPNEQRLTGHQILFPFDEAAIFNTDGLLTQSTAVD